MASELIRPHVVGFLDLMLKDQSQTLRVEEIEIGASSPWIGTDHNGNLWLFGGGGWNAGPDLWEFNPSTNEWAWMGGNAHSNGQAQAPVYGTKGVPAAGNFP